MEWMEDNFQYIDSDQATYWMSFSSICDEINNSNNDTNDSWYIPSNVETFLDIVCDYPIYTQKTYLDCMPWQVCIYFDWTQSLYYDRYLVL